MLLVKRIMNCLRIGIRKKVVITVLQCCTPAGYIKGLYNNTHPELFPSEIFYFGNFIMAWESKYLFIYFNYYLF